MSSTSLLRIFRITHLYFGVFITPALLFFALTGALQSFGLHETNRDHPNYKPAQWIAVLAQIHKKQTAVLPVRKPQPGAEKAPALNPAPPDATPHEGHGQHDGQAPGEAAAPSVTPSAAKAEPQPRLETSSQPRPEPKSQPVSQPRVEAPSQPVPAPPASPARTRNPVPLRVFFVLVCLGLFTSTITGLYMSYKYVRNTRLVTLTLIAGIVIPPLLLLF